MSPLNTLISLKNIPHISFEDAHGPKQFQLFELRDFFASTPSFKGHSAEKAHRLSFYALILVTKGTGRHQVDLEEFDLRPGTLIKVAKGQIHAFQQAPTYEGFLIVFTEPFMLNYFSKSSIELISNLYNYHINSPIAQNKTENEILLKELKEENDYARKNIIAKYLELYFLKLERRTSPIQLGSDRTGHYSKFIQFKALVESNYSNTRNVKDYTDLIHISNSQLNQIVKQFTLVTAKSFIDNYVILEAKRQIISTNKTSKEIAFDLGFDEITNFTKFFKNKVGETPGAYRSNQKH